MKLMIVLTNLVVELTVNADMDEGDIGHQDEY